MKSKPITMAGIAILIILTVTPLTSFAQSNGNQGGGRPQGPPPEAVEACEGKTAGDSVIFEGRRGESIEAVCQEIEGQLVAAPEGMEPPQ